MNCTYQQSDSHRCSLDRLSCSQGTEYGVRNQNCKSGKTHHTWPWLSYHGQPHWPCIRDAMYPWTDGEDTSPQGRSLPRLRRSSSHNWEFYKTPASTPLPHYQGQENQEGLRNCHGPEETTENEVIKAKCWAGEMAQQLRALTALQEVLSSILSNHMVAHNQPSVMGTNALFWCVWRQLQCTHVVVHTFNPSIWRHLEAETGRSLSSRTASATQRNPVSKTQKPNQTKKTKVSAEHRGPHL